jgi:hypothetical protein
MKRFFLGLFYSLAFVSCVKTDEVSPNPSTTSTGGPTSNTADIQKPLSESEKSADYLWDGSTAKTITLNGNSVKISGSGASAVGSQITISAAGTYIINGTLTNGQIKVKTTDKEAVKLVLNGMEITSNSTSPIFLDNAEKVIIILAEGTVNKVSDATTYTDVSEEQSAAIYAQMYTAVDGKGKLIVNGNFKDGISSKDGLLINSGNIVVNAVDDGIRGKDYLVIRDGIFDINTKTGDGLKSDFAEDKKYGYIQIDKGDFNLTTGGDAIAAQTTLMVKAGNFNITSGGGSTKTVTTGISSKGFKAQESVTLAVTKATVSSADDCINSDIAVKIEKGEYLLSSSDDGIHGTNSVQILDGDITIGKSFEGIESKAIEIEMGNFNIASSNDGINSTSGSDAQQNDGSSIIINGGTFIINSSNGDPLDSNGNITMTDGTVIIHGPSGMEVPIDYNGTFNINKGTIIASGGSSNMLQAPSASSKINSVRIRFSQAVAANTFFHIKNESGQTLVTFKPLKAYSSIIFSSDKLLNGNKYTVFGGGTSSGSETGGLFITGDYTGGSSKGSFSVNGTVTNITL